MRYVLVCTYIVITYLCSLDLFSVADFMYTVFFSASCCILFALIAKQIDSVFAEFFIILQAAALVTHALMSISYLFFDAHLMQELDNINAALLITDIIALIGVMLGDRWIYSRAG